MRIVVLSDSHGDVSNVNRILMSQSKAEIVFIQKIHFMMIMKKKKKI